MIQVLINDVVKRYFLGQPRNVRTKIRDKFEYLENGIWDGGLKVKKLKGISSKVVFEARLDRGNRILFSLGRDPGKDVKAAMAYVWGVVVHDNVSKTSRNVVPNEVPFLRFKDYREELYDELDLERLSADYFTQESISDRIGDDSAAQRWHRMDEPEWRRILRFNQDDFELFLHLSPEQEQILKTAPPLLVSGTAGSGKTTLSVYYLLKKGLRDQRKLFLTYNPHLRDFSKRLYDGLQNEREDASTWTHPEFWTFKGLCLDIARRYRRAFPVEKEVDFEGFDEIFSSHKLHDKFDAALVWEEIRSIIKGGMTQVNLSVIQRTLNGLEKNEIKPDHIGKLQTQFRTLSKLESATGIEKFTKKYLKTDLSSFAKHLDEHMTDAPDRVRPILEHTLTSLAKHRELTAQKHLSFFEYEMHGKKKAPNFRFNRKDIYQIFTWYEKKLQTGGLWDELDLVREVIEIISERDWSENQYDFLACDEVQDLTDVENELLFYLVKNPSNMLLAGDIKQIVNPSGFRWEEIKRHFFERGREVPELHYLTLNFRSSGNVVELSNTLLEIKQDLLGVRAGETKEEWKYKGRPAVVVCGLPEVEVLRSVRQAGAKRTILTRTDQERDCLKKELETELVFTIGEAKGLEFDTVLLWKFGGSGSSQDIWDVILKKSSKDVHEAKIKHEINLLYVGITRARRDLLVFDGPKPSSLWRDELISSKTFASDDCTYIDGIWNVISTPEEWREQGVYFFEREYYKAAVECFKNAGDDRRLAEASARHCEMEGNYAEAARHFHELEDWESAAENYQRAGQFVQALELWEKLKRKPRIFKCRIALLTERGEYEEVARMYESIRDFRNAVEHYRRSHNHGKVAEICDKRLKSPEEAAPYYEKAGNLRRAAAIYRKLKDNDKAASLYFKTGDYETAESLWKRSGNTQNLKSLYVKTEQPEKLLEIYEKELDFKRAVKTLNPMGGIDYLEEADSYFSARKYFSAWVRYHVAGNYLGVARACHKLKDYNEAARNYELAGEWFDAGKLHEKSGDTMKSLKCYINSKEDEERNYRNTKRVVRKVNYPKGHELGRKLFVAGEFSKAMAVCEGVRDYLGLGLCYAKMGEKTEAIRKWLKFPHLDMMESVARRCLDEGMYEPAADLIIDHSRLDGMGHYSTWEVPLNVKNYPSIFKVIERHFLKSNDKDQMARWASKLSSSEYRYENSRIIFKWYETAGRYNQCVTYLELMRYAREEQRESELRVLERQIPRLVKEGDHSGLALRYALLGMRDELNREVLELEMNPHNTELFEASDQYMKAVDYYLDLGQVFRARSIFASRGRLADLAPLLEQRGLYHEAADVYEVAGELEGAIRCYQQTDNYSKLGDVYFKLGDYGNALTMYQKRPGSNLKKIARTFEKMAQWDKALEIYRELGEAKGATRCVKKLRQAIKGGEDLALPF